MAIRFPKGVKKIVDLYADRIEEAVGLEVLWDGPLGSGSFGTVFPTEDDGKVLKISLDPTEGPVVKAVMDTGLDKKLDGLARWYGIWRIPGKVQEGPRSTGWVILREEVEPANLYEKFRVVMGEFPQWGDVLWKYNKLAREAIQLKTKRKANQRWEEADGYFGQLYNHEETYYVAEAIEELSRWNIRLADVHHENLGFRIHPTDEQEVYAVFWFDKKERPPLLIFDLGHSSAPSGVTVESLWEEAVHANPGIMEMGQEIQEI